jgi:hypothetical protein
MNSASDPSTVLIVSYHFYPAGEIGARRVTALAQYLAGKGVRVVVVSAFGNRAVERDAEILPGVIAVPVKRPRTLWLDLLVALKRRVFSQRVAKPEADHRGSETPPDAPLPFLARLKEAYFRLVYSIDDYKRWSWNAARSAVEASRSYRATVILASGPPHSGLLAGAWAARRLGIPYLADLRDPWSDLLAVTHPKRSIELRLLRFLERWVMRHAAAVTSTAATVIPLLLKRDRGLEGRIRVIRNGYDGAIAPPLTCTGGRLSILFAGFRYLARTPYPFLAALEELLSQPEVDPTRVRVSFMGGGSPGRLSDQALARWIQGKRCAAVVRILPAQASQAVAQEVAQATVLLNLAQQQQLHVPAKTYEHLAAGREMLLICESDCETARLVSGIRGVIQVDQSAPHVLTRVLFDLYERHVVAGTARVPAQADVQTFSREFSNQRFHALLASVAAARGTPPTLIPAPTVGAHSVLE